MTDAWDTFGHKEVQWVRRVEVHDQWNEGEFTTEIINLRTLPNYNVVRTWPIDMNTETGELDRQTIQLYFHKPYLENLGFINANGAFAYDSGHDRFILDGITYEPEGDTPASTARDEDQWITIILKREEKATGT
jgi:hypothetical protein